MESDEEEDWVVVDRERAFFWGVVGRAKVVVERRIRKILFWEQSRKWRLLRWPKEQGREVRRFERRQRSRSWVKAPMESGRLEISLRERRSSRRPVSWLICEGRVWIKFRERSRDWREESLHISMGIWDILLLMREREVSNWSFSIWGVIVAMAWFWMASFSRVIKEPSSLGNFEIWQRKGGVAMTSSAFIMGKVVRTTGWEPWEALVKNFSACAW